MRPSCAGIFRPGGRGECRVPAHPQLRVQKKAHELVTTSTPKHPALKLCMTRPAPTRERELTANKGSCPLQSENPAEAGTENAIRKAFLCANSVLRRAYPEGGSDAYSGLGDFDDRDSFDGDIGSGPDL